MTDDVLKACPFCAYELIEAEAFRTHTTQTFTHPDDAPHECPARDVRLLVIGHHHGGKDDGERLRLWNGAFRMPTTAAGLEELGNDLCRQAAQMGQTAPPPPAPQRDVLR